MRLQPLCCCGCGCGLLMRWSIVAFSNVLWIVCISLKMKNCYWIEWGTNCIKYFAFFTAELFGLHLLSGWVGLCGKRFDSALSALFSLCVSSFCCHTAAACLKCGRYVPRSHVACTWVMFMRGSLGFLLHSFSDSKPVSFKFLFFLLFIWLLHANHSRLTTP